MEDMLQATGLTTIDLYQYPQAALKNKIGNFDKADLQKSYAWSQGKDNETVIISIRSRQIGRKLQARTETASPTGINIAPYE